MNMKSVYIILFVVICLIAISYAVVAVLALIHHQEDVDLLVAVVVSSLVTCYFLANKIKSIK